MHLNVQIPFSIDVLLDELNEGGLAGTTCILVNIILIEGKELNHKSLCGI